MRRWLSFIEGGRKNMGNWPTRTLDPRLSLEFLDGDGAMQRSPTEHGYSLQTSQDPDDTRPIKCNGSPAIHSTLSFFTQTTTPDRSDLLPTWTWTCLSGRPSAHTAAGHDVLRVVWKFRHKLQYLKPGTWLPFDEPTFRLALMQSADIPTTFVPSRPAKTTVNRVLERHR